MILTEAQREIVDAATGFLDRRATREVMRAVVQSGTGHDPALWQDMQSLGWCALTVPEAHGGLGLGLSELIVLAEQLGARLVPVPFLEVAALAASVLAAPELHASAWLRRLVADAPVVAVSLEADAGLARRDGDAWVLEGQWPLVSAASPATWLLLPARTAQGLGLFVIDKPQLDTAPGLAVTPRRAVDLTQSLADVVARGLRLPALACLGVGPAAESALSRARLVGAIALAAEQVGLADAALQASVSYTGQRVQFDRPVASFQAVKHRCAQMLVLVESARSSVQAAADGFDRGSSSPQAQTRAAARSHVLATEAALFCTRQALQLHGGAGFTWDLDVHLMLRRAQAASQRLGSQGDWLEAFARNVLDGQPAGSDQGAPCGGLQPDGPATPVAASAVQPQADEHAANNGVDPCASVRREIRAWLQAQLRGEFASLRGLRGPGEPGFRPELARRWEQALAAGGWTAVSWPREFGGRGWSLAQQVAFHEEYARCEGPGRLGHIGEQLLAPTLLMHGTPEQRARFLPPIREGREFWAQGYSEPGAGSDLAAVRTRARLEHGHWLIEGQKVWTSWAHLSDMIFVLARTEPGSQRHQGLTLLLVPLRQPGVVVRPIRQITGHSEFNEVFFDGARTEAGLHLGPVGQGWRVAMDLLSVERGVSTLGQQAHFRQELDVLVAVARRNGAARDAVLRQRIARAALGLDALRCNALRVLGGGIAATGGMAGPQVGAPGNDRAAYISKYAWSNWRRDLGELAMDVLGSHGLVDSDDPDVSRLQRLWLESRADTIYAGTNEIQLNLIAERALGMPR